MGYPIPEHLIALAADVAGYAGGVQFALRCPCGCGRFAVEVPAEPDEYLPAYQIRCSACGEAYLLFDARVHGYDAMIGAYGEPEREYEYRPAELGTGVPEGFSVTVKLENAPSLEEFNEDCGEEYTYGQYVNGFSWIWITLADGQGHGHLLCDFETA